MAIGPFQIEHRRDVLSIHSQTFRDLDLATSLWQPCQQIESLEQDCIRLVYEDEMLKGYAAAYRLDDHHCRLNLIVHPDHRGQGIGSLLLDRVQSEIGMNRGIYLQARLFENMHPSRAFASSRGFDEVHVMRGMSLRSVDFSFDTWQELGEQLATKGLLATTLKDEFDKDPDPIEKLAKLHCRARDGWPSPDPTWETDLSVESCRANFTNIRFPEHFSIMKCGGEYVAYTSAKNRMAATAVDPGHRSKGVATYLKAHNLKGCIDSGQEHFESATANPAMQRVNEKLGYKLNGLAEVRFVKSL